MPLSDAAPRELLHDRHIECRGYRREDGLWDIEGHLVDTKSYAFTNRFWGEIAPGTPVHEMWIRLTVDDDLTVRKVETTTDAGPFPACPAITPAFQALAGLRIGPGWTTRVRQLLGGVKGCTHIVELLGPVATTAFQTIASRRGNEGRHKATGRKPPVIDSCHALVSDGAVVRELWPEFYTGA